MDEPLSNLDAKLRLEMRYELQRLHVETGSTFVYVTHDQMEAMTLATKICLINNGVLQQYDAPLDVYNRPANLFVADFVGNPSINFVEAKGKEQADGSFRFTILDDFEATFRPNEPIDMDAWFRKRDQDAADLEAQRLEMLRRLSRRAIRMRYLNIISRRSMNPTMRWRKSRRSPTRILSLRSGRKH